MAELLFTNFLYPFLLLSFVFFFVQTLTKKKIKNLPPGPKPFPIIGNLLELGEKPHRSLADLSKKYGPILSLRLGQVTTIVVSSPAMAKEILQTHDQSLSNRTIPESVRAHDHALYGPAWIPISSTWRNIRRICNSHLFSKRALDSNSDLRRKKVEELLDEVRVHESRGEAVEIGKAAFRASLSLISTTFFSEDLAGNHMGSRSGDVAAEIKELVWNLMAVVGEPNVADYFPLLKWIDPQGIKRRATGHFRKIIGLFDRIISQRLKVIEENGEAHEAQEKDVLDVLLSMMGKQNGHLDRNLIEHLLVDLFAAGTETTSSTLEWSMAELLRAPKAMSKVKEEVNRVIGKRNQVNESDINNLPYLQAVVKETLRLHPAVPLMLPRQASVDVQINRCYTIPQGSQILVNAWAINRDPGVWENPNEFAPERFFGSSIDFRGPEFELVPFGGGRRICPGLPLATRMLHLMLGSLIHNFEWKLESHVTPEMMNMDEKFGITLQMAEPLRLIPNSYPVIA